MRDYSQVHHIRKTIEERLLLGASINGFVDKILEQAPNTLIELIFDDDPIQNLVFHQKIIDSLDVLEQHMPAKDLYLQLVRQAHVDGGELLHLAINKYSEELWLIDLSKAVEGEMMGYHHMMRKRKDRSFLVWCFRYAWKGARSGLIQMAAETGNPIPSAALLRVGALEDAISAGTKALEHNPKSPVLEYMSSVNGPDLEEIVHLLLHRIPKDRIPESIQRIQKYYVDRE